MSDRVKEDTADTPNSRAGQTINDIRDGKLGRPVLDSIKKATDRAIQDSVVGGIGRNR